MSIPALVIVRADGRPSDYQKSRWQPAAFPKLAKQTVLPRHLDLLDDISESESESDVSPPPPPVPIDRSPPAVAPSVPPEAERKEKKPERKRSPRAPSPPIEANRPSKPDSNRPSKPDSNRPSKPESNRPSKPDSNRATVPPPSHEPPPADEEYSPDEFPHSDDSSPSVNEELDEEDPAEIAHALRVLNVSDTSRLGELLTGVAKGGGELRSVGLWRLARLEAQQRRAWLSGLWSLLFAKDSGDADEVWRLIEEVGPLRQGAKEVFNGFLWTRGDVRLPAMKAIIVGPSGSGKSTLFRALALEFLCLSVTTSHYKDIFVVGFDFRDGQISTVTDFYRTVADSVVNALLIQRPDLELLGRAIRRAFGALLLSPRRKGLPRAMSFEEYLSRPLKELDVLLSRMHEYYHTPDQLEIFLTNVAVLPDIVGKIFGFASTVLFVDHIDSSDIDLNIEESGAVRRVPLLEFVKLALSLGQFLIAPEDASTIIEKLESNDERTIDLTRELAVVPVWGVTTSRFPTATIRVELEGRADVLLKASHLGGCPGFVERFDTICESLEEMESLENQRTKRNATVEIAASLEELIGAVFESEEGEEAIGVRSFTLEMKS
jgi:adenylate kinase family enzyme